MAPSPAPDGAATRWRPPLGPVSDSLLDPDTIRTIRRARLVRRRRRAHRVLTRI